MNNHTPITLQLSEADKLDNEAAKWLEKAEEADGNFERMTALALIGAGHAVRGVSARIKEAGREATDGFTAVADAVDSLTSITDAGAGEIVAAVDYLAEITDMPRLAPLRPWHPSWWRGRLRGSTLAGEPERVDGGYLATVVLPDIPDTPEGADRDDQ